MKATRLISWVLAAGFAAAPALAQTTIKFATLAPEGSVWMKALRRGAADLKEKSAGTVLLKIYPGGVSGDEVESVRKMRLGQIQAAGMTGVGLAEILPEFQVLELPLLFNSGEEVDYVLEKSFDVFSKKFTEKGFRLLGLTETGFVRFFSRVPIEKLDDFKKGELKPWIWDQDKLHDTFFELLGMHPVPLPVPEVLAGQQTGMINNINAPPAAAVALQWHTKVDSMTADTYWWTSGGIVLTEKAWGALDANQQKVTAEVIGALAKELRSLARSDNQKAFEALQTRGIRVTTPLSADDRKRLEDIAMQVRVAETGKIYPKETLDAVEAAIREFRAAHPNP